MGEKVERMKALWALQKENHIDLFFSDESGFQLVPNLPYGWQAKCEYVRMLPRKGKNLSIFGLLSTDNRLVCYPTEQNTNADFVIQCLDDFAANISKPTVVIMDNAPIHKAKIVMNKRSEWEEKNLFIFFLPEYCSNPTQLTSTSEQINAVQTHCEDYTEKRITVVQE